MKHGHTTNSHYLTYTFLFKMFWEFTFGTWEWKRLTNKVLIALDLSQMTDAKVSAPVPPAAGENSFGLVFAFSIHVPILGQLNGTDFDPWEPKHCVCVLRYWMG